jgi:hypothetical protein
MPMYIAYTEYSKPNKIHPNLGMLDYFYLYNTHQSIASHAIGQRVTPFDRPGNRVRKNRIYSSRIDPVTHRLTFTRVD